MSTLLFSPLVPAKCLVDAPPEVFEFKIVSRFGDRTAMNRSEVVEVFVLRQQCFTVTQPDF